MSLNHSCARALSADHLWLDILLGAAVEAQRQLTLRDVPWFSQCPDLLTLAGHVSC